MGDANTGLNDEFRPWSDSHSVYGGVKPVNGPRIHALKGFHVFRDAYSPHIYTLAYSYQRN